MLRRAAGKHPHRLVQRKSDGRYYTAEGLWTEDAKAAKSFQSAMLALRECENLSAISTEIVFVECPEEGELHLTVR